MRSSKGQVGTRRGGPRAWRTANGSVPRSRFATVTSICAVGYLGTAMDIVETMQRCILFCFSIVAQRPRVSPPSRLGAADGLLVSLAHGLMRTSCDEQKQHWYCIMDFGSHTSGSDMAECRAPAHERRQKMFRERNNHNEAKQPGSKQLCNSKDQHKRRRAT